MIFYEGDDPEGFAAEIRERFAFDPSADPRWFGFVGGFSCPAEHYDAIGDSYRIGT